ncbi:MAG: nucleotide exchange factor GrpE [Firmicutes bacterium]|nr:nucleotide exchange factor GrpE [Bacillota bacterium]
MTEKTEGIKIEDAAADQPLEQEDADVSETTGDAEDIENTENTEEPAEESAEETEAPAEAAEPAEADDAKYLRLLAEFQNYKKRTEKEKTDLYSYANEKIMTELLEVLDNFERALEQEAGDGFKEGMELIFTQLTNVLTKAGLAEITALGEDFDPNVHNAVMAEETEEYESGKVSGVMQKGYTLNGKVIRPSMVKVAN